MLFRRLKNEYENKDLLSESKDFGISRATAIRWNDGWLEDCLIQRIHRGIYKKSDETNETNETNVWLLYADIQYYI